MEDDLKAETESKRLEALRKLKVMNTPPEVEFDALAKAAALACDTLMSSISLIAEERQWLKASVGLSGMSEMDRSLSFCRYTIEGDELLEVGDTRSDVRFSDHPLVTGQPKLRFYAGVPLKLSGGENVGSICVMDTRPRHLSETQKDVLCNLAKAASKALEARRAAFLESQLVEFTAQNQSILQHSQDAILTMDLDGRIIQWNLAAERMFGYSAEEARGASVDMLIAEDAEKLAPYVRLARAGNTPSARTVRLHRTGTRIPVSVSIGPVISDDGDIVGATEIIRDISDMLTIQEELSEAEQRVRRLYQATPAMLYSVDPDGVLLSVSDRWLEIMDYQREDVIGRRFSDFMPDQAARHFQDQLFPDLLREGHYEDVAGQMITREGARIDVMHSATLERSQTGAFLRSVGIIENISRRREVERDLRDERRRLEQIIAATRAGTWEWNVDTGENRVNAEWLHMLGYRPGEIDTATIGSFRALVHPDDQNKLEGRIQAHLSGRESHLEAEIRLSHKQGHWVWVATRGQLLPSPHQDQSGWMFGTHQDISERKHEEEELRRGKEFLDRAGKVAGVGGWEVDLATGALHWSDETCRLHGVEPGVEVGLERAIDFYAEQSKPIIEAAVENAMATGEGWDLELQLETAKGRLIWVRAVGETEIQYGKVVRLVGALQDVTERVAQRKAMEDVNQRFAVATENGQIGIWDADLVSGKTIYSDIWRTQLGYDPSEIFDDGLFWLSAVHPDDIERVNAANKAHLRGEMPYFEEQFRMRHQDGHWIWILDRGLIAERDETGNPVRMIGTHIDITSQKEREAERLLMSERMAIAADTGGIGIWEVNMQTQEASWDEWMYRLYGLPVDTPGSLIDLWARYTEPEDAGRVRAAYFQAIESNGVMEEDYRIIWPDGSTRHLHTAARLVPGVDGEPSRFIGASWDVTEERQLALELAEQHELMRITLQSIGDAVVTADAQGNIRWLNPVAEYMTGWSAQEAHGLPSHRVFNIIHEETRWPALDPIRTCLELRETVGLSEDTVLLCRGGGEFAVEDSCAPIRGADDEVLGAVLVFHDVSEQRRLSREMSYRASHDQLTGLINRSEFEHRLQVVHDMVRNGNPDAALLFIDLDRFKIVNDSCGHAVGDQLLKSISELMQSVIRANDALARLGGDEFAVIIENCPIETAIDIAENICAAVAGYLLVHDGKQYRVGASIGLTMIGPTATSVSSILQEADAACYAAKEAGRNRVHLWRQNDKAIEARLGQASWVERIEQALEGEGFVLYAQKIVPFDKPDGKVHVELLLRMLGENGSIIPPGAFLPASERFNLASRIDRWVLSHAIEWMASAGAGNHSIVSVNISGQSVGDRAFHRFALELLDATSEVLRRSLCLEITETAVISNIEEAGEFIGAVRERGVKIALDDFGAGASSFNYLKRFSIDFLKIDGQFTQGVLKHPVDEATIRCFVDIARILEIETVAEYVSDEKIAARLQAMGVDLAQGYVYHLPEPAAGLKL